MSVAASEPEVSIISEEFLVATEGVLVVRRFDRARVHIATYSASMVRGFRGDACAIEMAFALGEPNCSGSRRHFHSNIQRHVVPL
jgi:hypothetical protein